VAYRLPPLGWIRSFEAGARLGSFSGAALELNLTSTAVSHQIRSLEKFLGYPLFERLPRSVRLTGMGAAYLPEVRRALEQLAATTVKLFGMGIGSTVTVRAPLSFVSLFLAPRLARFQAAYPDISIQLFSLLWADAIPDESADIDIRFGGGTWSGYDVEPLIREQSVIVVPSRLGQLAKQGPKRLFTELQKQPLIHIVGYEDHWEASFRLLGIARPPEKRSIRVDNSLAALMLVANGLGSAITLKFYAQAAAELLPVSATADLTLPVESAHYLLTPRGRQPVRPETLLFRAWLLDEVKRFQEESENAAAPRKERRRPSQER
jgi:LysR family transcriptional regulator, glycine cleavage system transcriptional activator